MMKLNLLVATSQLNSKEGRSLGTGTLAGLRHLGRLMHQLGIKGDIFELPMGSREAGSASPFSLNSGFALNPDELDIRLIPELKTNPGLQAEIQSIEANYAKNFGHTRKVSYILKRSLQPWILQKCYAQFGQRTTKREEDYQEFLKLAAYWLDHYVAFMVKQDLQACQQAQDAEPMEENFHRYVQFLCFEQRRTLKKDLAALGIGLVVNLPFGVEMHSPDVEQHPEVFDTEYQVGCSPEPEHGYPEQAWGIARYKERSEGLKNYLTQRLHWLAHFGEGIFLDHLVGWCGQYVVPMQVEPDSQYPYGHFLTENQEQRMKNMAWFLDVVLESGLRICGEIAGDHNRVDATRQVVERYLAAGHDISVMMVPRWEREKGRLKPLKSYGRDSLLMLETHDTSTLVQYLLNRKGGKEDFESLWNVLEFATRVLALPVCYEEMPFIEEEMNQEFCEVLARRLVQGSAAKEVVFSLPSLISLLSPSYRSDSLQNNINVQPGTTGEVGNPWKNWSYFSPPLEVLSEQGQLAPVLASLGDRIYLPFDYFHEFPKERQSNQDFNILWSKPEGREVLYKNDKDQWLVLPEEEAQGAVLELVIINPLTHEIWGRLDVSTLLELNQRGAYVLMDLANERERFRYESKELLINKLFIQLKEKARHHFLVFRDLGDLVNEH